MLSCSDLEAGYLNRPVLHGVAMEVPGGGVVAVIGPNGHGKSTLLRTFSGLLTPRAGRITFAGEDITHAKVHARVEAGLVHVPQGDQLFTDMTVEENLLMGAYLCTDSGETRNRLERVYALFPKLEQRRTQIASSLSGGERRMTGIGRGLMAQARLLMLDEPSLGLAPLVVDQIYKALASLREEGLSILVVEENPSRLLAFADGLCLMDAGRVVWNGDTAEARRSEDILNTYLGGH